MWWTTGAACLTLVVAGVVHALAGLANAQVARVSRFVCSYGLGITVPCHTCYVLRCDRSPIAGP